MPESLAIQVQLASNLKSQRCRTIAISAAIPTLILNRCRGDFDCNFASGLRFQSAILLRFQIAVISNRCACDLQSGHLRATRFLDTPSWVAHLDYLVRVSVGLPERERAQNRDIPTKNALSLECYQNFRSAWDALRFSRRRTTTGTLETREHFPCSGLSESGRQRHSILSSLRLF